MNAPCLTKLLSAPCLLCGISGPSACSCGILRPWLPQPALRAAGAGKSISKSQVVMPAAIRCPLQLMLLKKPAQEPDKDEIKPSADYCGGKRGPLSRGECISNLVLGETYRLRQVTHKSTAERARDEDTVAAHLIASAQPSHCRYEQKQATSRANPYSATHHSHIFSLNKKDTHTICTRDGMKKKNKSLV